MFPISAPLLGLQSLAASRSTLAVKAASVSRMMDTAQTDLRFQPQIQCSRRNADRDILQS
jgi:hypothetical protein